MYLPVVFSRVHFSAYMNMVAITTSPSRRVVCVRVPGKTLCLAYVVVWCGENWSGAKMRSRTQIPVRSKVESSGYVHSPQSSVLEQSIEKYSRVRAHAIAFPFLVLQNNWAEDSPTNQGQSIIASDWSLHDSASVSSKRLNRRPDWVCIALRRTSPQSALAREPTAETTKHSPLPGMRSLTPAALSPDNQTISGWFMP